MSPIIAHWHRAGPILRKRIEARNGLSPSSDVVFSAGSEVDPKQG